jgi:hypothetical protein
LSYLVDRGSFSRKLSGPVGVFTGRTLTTNDCWVDHFAVLHGGGGGSNGFALISSNVTSSSPNGWPVSSVASDALSSDDSSTAGYTLDESTSVSGFTQVSVNTDHVTRTIINSW